MRDYAEVIAEMSYSVSRSDVAAEKFSQTGNAAAMEDMLRYRARAQALAWVIEGAR